MAVVDLETFKKYMKVNRGADPADDDLLDGALDAAETLVNTMTGRTFAVAGASSARTFYGSGNRVLQVDDFVSVTTVADGAGTLAGVDYQPVRVPSGQPYNQLVRSSNWPRSSGFPNVTVTAAWGWTAIPAPVVQAVMIVAKDIVANRDVSFGIAGFTEYGGVRARENPQVAMLLAPYDLRVMVA